MEPASCKYNVYNPVEQYTQPDEQMYFKFQAPQEFHFTMSDAKKS